MINKQEKALGFQYLLEKISLRGSDTANASAALKLLMELKIYLTSVGQEVPNALIKKIEFELIKVGYPGGIEIIFTKNIVENFDTDAIIFEATINGKRLVCRVSHEALEDNFDKSEEMSYLDVYYKNVKKIENKAERKIRLGEYTFENGLILISADF